MSLLQLRASFDGRPVRERLLVGLTLWVLIVVSVDMLGLAPVQMEQQSLQQSVSAAELENTGMELKLAELKSRLEKDNRAARQQQLEALRSEIQQLEQDLQNKTQRLVNPEQMLAVLQDLFERSPKVRLVSMHNLPPRTAFAVPLLPEELAAVAPAAVSKATALNAEPPSLPVVYEHGLSLEFTGSYFAILDYLKHLEGLQWQFYWDALAVDMEQFPVARARLRVYTLSLNPSWIGA